MVDNDTLLSHLISRITERTEDIAVEALGYILNKSPAARGALEYPVKADGLDSGLCRHDSSSEASETLKPGFRCCRCLLIATVRRRAPTTFPDYPPGPTPRRCCQLGLGIRRFLDQRSDGTFIRRSEAWS